MVTILNEKTRSIVTMKKYNNNVVVGQGLLFVLPITIFTHFLNCSVLQIIALSGVLFFPGRINKHINSSLNSTSC